MKLDDDSKSTMDQSDEAKPGVFALLLQHSRLAGGSLPRRHSPSKPA